MVMRRVIPLVLVTVAVYAVAVTIGESAIMAAVWALVSGAVGLPAAVALRGEE